jgi:hypothetical protein
MRARARTTTYTQGYFVSQVVHTKPTDPAVVDAAVAFSKVMHPQPPSQPTSRSCSAAHTRVEYDAAIAFSKLLDTVARCTR